MMSFVLGIAKQDRIAVNNPTSIPIDNMNRSSLRIGTPQARKAMIWLSPERPLSPIRIPIRKESGRVKIRMLGSKPPVTIKISRGDAFLVIRSSDKLNGPERAAASCMNTTNVRTLSVIKNGGMIARNRSLSILLMAGRRLA
jgi:hypothetical protein